MSTFTLTKSNVTKINVIQGSTTTSLDRVIDTDGNILWQRGDYAPFSGVRLSCDSDNGDLRIIIEGSSANSKTFDISCTLHIRNTSGTTTTKSYSVSRTQNSNNNLVITTDYTCNTAYTYWVTDILITNDDCTDTELSDTDKETLLGVKIDVDTMLTFYTEREYTGSTLHGITRNSAIHSFTSLTDSVSNPTDVGTYTTTVSITDTWHYWSDTKNRQAKTQTFKITKKKKTITKPSLLSTKTYNGSYLNVIQGYDSEYMNCTSNTTINTSSSDSTIITHRGAGTFQYFFSLKTSDNYEYVWSDGTTSTVSLTVTVNKQSVTTPTVIGTLIYTGEQQRIIRNYDSSLMTYSVSSGSVSVDSSNSSYLTHKNSGSFYVYFSLKDTSNYQWSDGTTSKLTVSVTVYKHDCPFAGSNATFYKKSGEPLRIRTATSTKTLVDGVSFSYTAKISKSATSSVSGWTDTVTGTATPNSNYRLIIADTDRTSLTKAATYSGTVTISATDNFKAGTITITSVLGSNMATS